MSEFIPLSVPSIEGNEWKYIKECLDSGWVSSSGRYVDRFEDAVAGYTGVSHAIACVNGTSALHIALLVAGVQPGDEVIVPTLTFIASVNSIRYAGAEPIFMDCDRFYNIDIEKTIEFIKKETISRDNAAYNRTTQRKISAIIPVHVFGNPVWFDELVGICAERNIKIIEDATESLGSFYADGAYRLRHTGTIGSVGCLSFNGNKIITTGGGGMILTNDPILSSKAKYLTTQAKNDEVHYLHDEVGYNYRMSNIQAALGLAQIEKLDEFCATKRRNFRAYKEGIESLPGLVLAEAPEYGKCNHWMYPLQIRPPYRKNCRDELMQIFLDNGIQSRPVWYLNHLQKPYQNCQSYKIEKAIELIACTLNIPCSVNLKDEDVNKVIRVLKENAA